MKRVLDLYILPGLVFQSVLVGGGYATGREIVEFFLKLGPATGLVGIIVATVAMSITLAVAFEFARILRAFDYKSFMDGLLGPASILFEAGYYALLLLVLSVIAAAAGRLGGDILGIPHWGASLILACAIGVLALLGTRIIELFMSVWSILLYGAYVTLFLLAMKQFGGAVWASLSADSASFDAVSAGVSYAGLSIPLVPALIFVARRFTTSRQALGSGIFAGPLIMLPAALFYLALTPFYPEIIEAELPIQTLMSSLHVSQFSAVFEVIILGTFIETGVGMLHAVNERVSHAYSNKKRTMPNWMRPTIALGGLTLAVFLAQGVGIITLVAAGYRWSTLYFLVVLLAPLLTIGVWKILRSR